MWRRHGLVGIHQCCRTGIANGIHDCTIPHLVPETILEGHVGRVTDGHIDPGAFWRLPQNLLHLQISTAVSPVLRVSGRDKSVSYSVVVTGKAACICVSLLHYSGSVQHQQGGSTPTTCMRQQKGHAAVSQRIKSLMVTLPNCLLCILSNNTALTTPDRQVPFA